MDFVVEKPVRTKLWPQRGLLGEEEKNAADALFQESIKTGVAFGYNGQQENDYCEEFAAFLGGGYVDAVNSGTSAIYTALRALEIEPFSEVIVGAVTDPGGMMPIPLLNCIPFVADVTPDSFNTGPREIEELITPRTSAIVVPHIAGEPADMEAIMKIAGKHGLPVVEDCSQAHGASQHGKLLGTFGDVAVFSTMFGKHHCTGGQGGIVYTKDEAMYWKIRRLTDRGKPFNLPEGSTHQIASLNMNLNDLSAAIGREQLKKLPHILACRRKVVDQIAEELKDIPYVSLPRLVPGGVASYWFLRLHLNLEALKCELPVFVETLMKEGLTPVTYNYSMTIPHRADWFAKRRVFGSSGLPWSSSEYKGDKERQFPCPNTISIAKTDFNVGINEAWGDEEIQDLISIFRKVGERFGR